MTKNPMQNRGFTIIEVMIAIAVFAIGILGVLQMIIRNIVVVDLAKQKSFATLLAKEGIEIVYNMRDSNLQKYLPRDCVLNPELKDLSAEDISERDEDEICDYRFASGAENSYYLQLSLDPEGYIYSKRVPSSEDFFQNFEINRIYQRDSEINSVPLSRYSNEKLEDPDAETIFARYIVFKPLEENGEILDTDKILKVESHVLVFKGNYTGDIVLESFIGNY